MEEKCNMREYKCNCHEIQFGTYENSFVIQKPFGRKNYVNIDVCIAKEIIDLWVNGIETTGCCCGHGKRDGYIGVIDEHITKMKGMGYEVAPNPCYPESENSFYPISVKRLKID